MPTEAYRTFMADPRRRERYLVEISRRKHSDGTTDTLRYRTGDPYATGAEDSPAHTPYEGNLLEPPNISAQVPGFDDVGLVGGGQSTVKLAIDWGDLEADFDPATYAFDGLAITVRHGGDSPIYGGKLPLADYNVVFEGLQSTPRIDLQTVVIPVRPKHSGLSDPLQRRRFGGFGYCSYLKSSTSAITLGSPSELDTEGDFTLAIRWWKHASISSAARIWTWFQAGGSDEYPWDVGIKPDGKVRVVYTASGSTKAMTFEALTWPDDRWVCLSVVRDGRDVTCTIYDEREDTETVETVTQTHDADNATATCSIGRTASQSAVGLISEAWFVGEVVASDTLRKRRQRPLTDAEKAETDGYWDFDQTTGSTIADGSGNSNDGTVAGTHSHVPSLTGHSGLTGVRQRDAFGKVLHGEPTPIDPIGGFYHCHPEALSTLTPMQGGADFATISKQADVFTFLDGAGPAAAEAWTLLHDSGSFFRLAAIPSLPLGFASTTAIGTDSAADLAEHILLNRGSSPLASGEIESGWKARLNSQAPGKCGHQFSEEADLGGALSLFLGASAGAQYGFRQEDQKFYAWQVTGIPILDDGAGSELSDLEIKTAASSGATSIVVQRTGGKPLFGDVVRGASIEIGSHGKVYRIQSAALAASDEITLSISPALAASASAGAAVTLDNVTESLSALDLAGLPVAGVAPEAAYSYALGWGRVSQVLGPDNLSASADPGTAGLLQEAIHTATSQIQAVLDRHADAREASAESAISERSGAIAEIDRRLALLSKPGFPLRLPVPPGIFDLRGGDVIRLDYQDLAPAGGRQARLYGSRRYLVLGTSLGPQKETVHCVRFVEETTS